MNHSAAHGPSEQVTGAVVGVGIDLADIDLVRQAIRDFGERYLERVFTEGELRYCSEQRDNLAQLSVAFAAKEAAIKALGVSGARPPWRSVELRHDARDALTMRLSGEAAKLAAEQGVQELHVSVSRTSLMAVAAVVATTAR